MARQRVARSHQDLKGTPCYYYYYQFFQRWVPQKAKMPVQGGLQNKQTYTHN